MTRGRIFVLDGTSGSGKRTVLAALLARPELRLQFCRRVTTRPPRADDEGDYDYVSQSEMDAMVEAGEMASHRQFKFGMSYGLPRKSVEAAREQGDVLVLTDLGTVPQVRECWPDCVCILLSVSLDELRARIEKRGLNTPEQIDERVANARDALALVPLYDYVVSNPEGQLERTLSRLSHLIRCPC